VRHSSWIVFHARRSDLIGLLARVSDAPWPGESGEQVSGVHGLRQVGVEPGLERALPVVGLTVSADRDEDHLDISGAEVARDLVTVHPGQPDVDEDDVGATRLRGRPSP